MKNLLLILNACEGRLQTVFVQDEDFLCAQSWNVPRQGAELLAPLLVDAFRQMKRSPCDLARIACVCGPGTFTGIRLVLATTAAMRRATCARVAALNLLPVLAAALRGIFSAQRVRVLAYARRGLVYSQDFSLHGAELPEAASEAALLDLSAAMAEPLPEIMIGSGVTRNCAFFHEHASQHIRLLPHLYDHPSSSALAALALALPESAWLDADLEPLYLRPCEAEENLAAIAKKLGDDPEQVQTKWQNILQQNPAKTDLQSPLMPQI